MYSDSEGTFIQNQIFVKNRPTLMYNVILPVYGILLSQTFIPVLFYPLDPGIDSGVNFFPDLRSGMKNFRIRIQDKHPGYAPLQSRSRKSFR
jgi:hypothetical protein